jgi:hypothetical protein
MKNIEQDKLEKLLEIIPSSPALRIAHFTDGGEMMIEVLSDFCQKKEYEYQINCTDNSFFDFISDKYKDITNIKTIKFRLDRPRYMIQAKMYEYVFVTSSIGEDMRDDFTRKVHSIIKNAGNILIFLPKGSYEERYSWTMLLEEHYYVASNTIDDLFVNYDVLISKKMHGWGG